MPDHESKPQVLLVDDSVDVHRLVKVRLKAEPVEIISAMNGNDGLEMARAVNPSLILLDLDMPGVDGFEVLRKLRADNATAPIPVIVVSGLDSCADKVTAFELGAADYITKPLEFAELRARMRSALRTQRLLALLAERAEVDGLTGLGNRQQFNRRWEQEFASFARYGNPLTLAILDVDHFKKVNDTFGHPAGDEVLQGFARIIQTCIRNTDIACRFGGEEVAVIMPHTTPNDAFIVAERIRNSLQSNVWPRHPEHFVTVSIGLAGASGLIEGLTKERWLEAADQALYTAKRTGRNRVILGSLQPGAAPATTASPANVTPPAARAG
ncbi:MAG: diguanylate cyclase [Phycisphaerales bacterium]|nr:diguanylate cyclase [Phycisphaerales bacterium]